MTAAAALAARVSPGGRIDGGASIERTSGFAGIAAGTPFSVSGALKSVYSLFHLAGVASFGRPYFYSRVSISISPRLVQRTLLSKVIIKNLHPISHQISFSFFLELWVQGPIFEDKDPVP